MAETSAQQKNLPASQRKLDKARADGQVARSRDLGHFAAVAGGGALLDAGAGPALRLAARRAGAVAATSIARSRSQPTRSASS